jgi:capsular exopolysaccharide synthesis family protein
VWRSLQRRWVLALTVGLLLGALAATAAWFLRPAKYTTFALVKVASEQPQLLPQERVVNDQELYRQTQAALLKSPKVLKTALQQEKVLPLSLLREESDVVGWLDSALTVETIRNTELLKVSLSGQDPNEVAVLVNAILQAYLQEVVNKEQRQRLERLNDLTRVCSESEEKLRKQRKKLQGVAESLKASDPETATLRQKIALEEYAALRKELLLLGAELRQAENGRDFLAAQGSQDTKTLIPDAAVELALDDHPDVQAQAKKVAKSEELLEQLRTKAKPGYSGIAEIEKEVQAGKEELKALRERLRRKMEETVRHRTQMEAQSQAAKQGNREGLLKQQFQAVQKEVDELQKAADRIGLEAILYKTQQNEIEQAEKIVKSLWAEKERLEVERRSNAQRVSIEVEAEPPQTKNRKTQFLTVGLAGLLFFFVGAFGAAYSDYRASRIHSQEEVTHGLGLRVLGSLPVMPNRLPAAQLARTGAHLYSRNLWQESISGIRTMLLYEASQRPLRVVMVTSAGPLEGKTTLASHLAVSIAAAGRRTLLIDADLRRPVLHRIFETDLVPGLSEALRGERILAETICPTPSPSLWLCPAGEFNGLVPELLAQNQLAALLEPLRAQYDFIVIDSSPILPVNDALQIGQHVDAVLLSIRPDQSREPLVRDALDRLRALHIPVLGTVLNGSKTVIDQAHYRYLSHNGK